MKLSVTKKIWTSCCLGSCFVISLLGLPGAHSVFAQTDTPNELNEAAETFDPDQGAPAAGEQAEDAVSAVEVNGDVVEYHVEDDTLVAQGNVTIEKDNVILTCDKVTVHRGTNLAHAEGDVVLRSPEGEIRGQRMDFNFETMTGDFEGARIIFHPFYGRAPVISKVGENHIVMEGGYLTTSDFDKPEYRLASKKIDIYPGEKAVARHVRFLLGKAPVLYVPKYTQDLREREPQFLITPGYEKDWGAFVLTQWRYRLSEQFKGVVHVDYRERKDLAWGFDVNYKTRQWGDGIIRTYYMNERNITSKHPWEEKPSPTIERERFKIEYRHKWEIDDTTTAIGQYYKLSDAGFLKEYFKNEYEEEGDPDTFFLFTKNLPKGTFSFLTDIRVNRFENKLEKLPEIEYNLSNQRIGPSRLYLKSITTYSNLTDKTAAPSEVREKTMRLNMDNEISHPFKVAFMEFRPFAGGQNTYYSRTPSGVKNNLLRGQFKTGADLSTKFFKVMDVETNIFGMDIHQLRHIVTPSIAYIFKPDPTIPNSQIDQFDATDNLKRKHSITFEVENKLQTKRDDESVDLLRWILTSEFYLKENPGSGGFNTVTSDIEFNPNEWLQVYTDAVWNSQSEQLDSANLDVYIHDKDKWSFSFGKRYQRDVDDQITASWRYKINPKWTLSAYERFDINAGLQKEFEVSILRDLHSWDMEINFNETRGQGSEIWVVFTLKAFPEILLDFGTSFNKRKAGSQSSP